MFAQEDLAHAAGAELLQHLVLADGEPLALALEELLGLEVGEEAVADEQRRRACRARSGIADVSASFLT